MLEICLKNGKDRERMRERMSIKAIRICVKDSVKMRFECVECKIGRNGRWV
ncbi:hypothetical protein HP922_001765 [Campylobacter coli]|nr:hypothetical protein [Campylobacter coli]EIO4172709.1 hypothetical protein [Campylobacter coli]EIQ9586868.1 hypothetical protein [Campylobacter coli]ELB3233405.1 hypothetical protein [Campylobacter coli]